MRPRVPPALRDAPPPPRGRQPAGDEWDQRVKRRLSTSPSAEGRTPAGARTWGPAPTVRSRARAAERWACAPRAAARLGAATRASCVSPGRPPTAQTAWARMAPGPTGAERWTWSACAAAVPAGSSASGREVEAAGATAGLVVSAASLREGPTVVEGAEAPNRGTASPPRRGWQAQASVAGVRGRASVPAV